ncbi:MAG: helix-turn-helix transcriptional regulator, partial [Alphaproteobacteria bacterium]|nr:helix-turn-helix transcriptional regulator [Alphaproteobacteria bacterium]
MSVAKNLRLLRRIRGLTLEELSEQVGISVSYLSRIESGNRRVTEPLLFKLSELLQCDPTEILSDEPPEK